MGTEPAIVVILATNTLPTKLFYVNCIILYFDKLFFQWLRITVVFVCALIIFEIGTSIVYEYMPRAPDFSQMTATAFAFLLFYCPPTMLCQ